MLPDGDVMILGLFWIGERVVPFGEFCSTGVGGVFTIAGAALKAVDGGVCGLSFVVIVGIRGLGFSLFCGAGKIAPILAATLSRLEAVSPSSLLAACAGEGSGLRSGLPFVFGFGLVLRRTKAPLSLSTGEVGRLSPNSVGASKEAVVYVRTSEAPTLSWEELVTADARSSASMWLADLTSGEEVVR